MPIPRLRPEEGPAILSYGFRPFFFLGALYAGLSILIWLPMFFGAITLPTEMAPVDWHFHELFFGYLSAVITGFLFTAVPNWTGRMPIQGWPLLVLVLLWLAGRLAVAGSAILGWWPSALIDLAFLAAIALVIANEIVAGRNWRNLKVLLPLTALFLANVLFYVEVRIDGTSDISRRLAMAAVVTLIMLIGGRIIPSFTRNWLVKENPGRLPAPFGGLDWAVMAVSIAALAAWVAIPEANTTGWLLALAAVSQLIRLARWAGDRTLREPLLTALHVSYLFVPLGLGLLAMAALAASAVSPLAGIHALGVGAIGGMTLSVMARATLGHTGRPLRAGPVFNVLFACVVIAALARVLESLEIGNTTALLHLSALGWIVAFGGFAVLYAPLFFRPRPKRKS